MRLYLLRHAIAEDAAPTGKDADRELTPKGVKKLREVLKMAEKYRYRAGLVLTSPLLRARQTAEVAVSSRGAAGSLLETRALAPDSTPEAVWDEVRMHSDEPDVTLVGHEPLFSSLYAYLLDAPTLRVNVKKASLGRIDLDAASPAPRGVLRWLLAPEGEG